MKKTILLFVLFLISTPSFASDWFQLDEKNYIDLESIEQHKDRWEGTQYDKYSFWIKSLNDKSARFIDLEKLYKRKVWYEMQNYIIDCNQKSIATNGVVTYGMKNDLINQYNPYSLNYTKIIPDSNGELWYYMICELRQIKKNFN